MTNIFDAKLLPCPFCGGGITEFHDNGRVWAGMKYSDPISVSVRHWCAESPPSRMIERIGRDKEQAIERWNKRSSVEDEQPEKKSTNLDSLRRDAQRYRFLREMDRLEAFVAIEQLDYSSNDEFDASVDTAMARQTPKGE